MDEQNLNTGVEQNNEEQATLTYTQEQVAELLQKETDRRVSSALAKQKKEYEKKMSLTKLDDNEREKAEQANTIAELREQLAAFQIEKNRSELKSVLSSRGLSAEFADIIQIGDDIEAAQANIDRLDKLFKAAVRAEVEKRLAGSSPKGNGAAALGTLTKEQFSKLSIAELQKMRKDRPEEYNRLCSM